MSPDRRIYRPLALDELDTATKVPNYDKRRTLRDQLFAADGLRIKAQSARKNGDYEAAFVYAGRAVVLIKDLIPDHSEYRSLTPEQATNLAANATDLQDLMSSLKRPIYDRYEAWLSAKDKGSKNKAPDLDPPYLQPEEIYTRDHKDRSKRTQQAPPPQQAVYEYPQRNGGPAQWEQQRAAAQSQYYFEAQDKESEAMERERVYQEQLRKKRQLEEYERVKKIRDQEIAAERRRKEEFAQSEIVAARGYQPATASSTSSHGHDFFFETASTPKAPVTRPYYPPTTEASRPAQRDGPAPRPLPTAPHEYPAAAPQLNYRPPPNSALNGLTFESDTPPTTWSSSSRPSYAGHNSTPSTSSSSSVSLQGVLPLENPDVTSSYQQVLNGLDSYSIRDRSNGMSANGQSNWSGYHQRPPTAPPIEYPKLMNEHQKDQGFVPSRNSIFSPPPPEPSANPGSSGWGGRLAYNLPSASTYVYTTSRPQQPKQLPIPPSFGTSAYNVNPPAPNIPPPDSGPTAGYYHYTPARPDPGSMRPAREPMYQHTRQAGSTSSIQSSHVPRPESQASRYAPEAPNPSGLKRVILPRSVISKFVSIASLNTARRMETCGLLFGRLGGPADDIYTVTTLLIPRQDATENTCTMVEEELIVDFQLKRDLLTLGWIHTHPTQSCFMSSLDLHTHSGFQSMLKEAFAIVCAPSSTPDFGIFRLTDPPGLDLILNCKDTATFHPHPSRSIYTDADEGHVQFTDLPLEIVDLRKGV